MQIATLLLTVVNLYNYRIVALKLQFWKCLQKNLNATKQALKTDAEHHTEKNQSPHYVPILDVTMGNEWQRQVLMHLRITKIYCYNKNSFYLFNF